MLGLTFARDLRLVRLYWLESERTPTEYIISKGDLPKFVKATLKLHHEPGRNPHKGMEAAKLGAILVRRMVSGGPYWWSTPDLMENDDPVGAKIWSWSLDEEVLWVREGFNLKAVLDQVNTSGTFQPSVPIAVPAK